MIISITGYCRKWGSAYGARRVHGLTPEEREAVKAGQEVRIIDCPPFGGTTSRRVIYRDGCFYARMPAARATA